MHKIKQIVHKLEQWFFSNLLEQGFLNYVFLHFNVWGHSKTTWTVEGEGAVKNTQNFDHVVYG